ncbi:TPA: bleomycin resistance family protein [Candidatus Dependentiae bacterium]|nr:MAG: hypothetical protein UW09_C0003G0123 [candidate division TM6 bacterium GW2011_GWF2_43_87]HBL98748.1 bleomycin resistance family protein [Candidatus Dependentiae bacterium]
MTPAITNITPNLTVKNVQESIEFYTKLGFSLRIAITDKKEFHQALDKASHYIYAQVTIGNLEIMLQSKESVIEDNPFLKNLSIASSITLFCEVTGVEAFFASLKGKVEIVKPLNTTWYGMQEFYIRDNNGYILGFAEKAK